MILADKCIVVGCLVYDIILMETGKFSDNIRVTENGLEFYVLERRRST